jgi:hypothetical protein
MTVFGDDPGLNAQETYKELLKQLEDWNRLVDNKAQQAKIPNLKLKSTLCSLLAENLRIILDFKNFQLHKKRSRHPKGRGDDLRNRRKRENPQK